VPKVALRETIINAVAHTDYSQRGAPIRISIFDDRIEVENPGLLPSGVTVDDIRRGISKIRNRVIGRVFHELKLIEQWGSGIQRMTAACRESGLDDPGLEEIGTRFRVTLSAVPKKSLTLDPIDRAVLSALSKGKGLSTREISTIISRSARATRLRLLSLIERSLVKEVGSGLKDPRRRYYLTG
jgi:ATP-dependent DNA helicase RecG